MKPVGYLVNTKEGLEGEVGTHYNYILASNGLFVRAEKLVNDNQPFEGTCPILQATVLVAEASVRGLLPLEEAVNLPQGRIPRYFYDLALSAMAVDRECYLAVTWEGMYHLDYPAQDGSSGKVKYERRPNTLLDIHSHGRMSAFSSPTDNTDEQGLGLYMVVGKLDMLWPEFELRVGVYGYFAPIKFNEVFGV